MNMATDESENDPRILTLAAEIAEAVDREVPILLIKVRGRSAIRASIYYLWHIVLYMVVLRARKVY